MLLHSWDSADWLPLVHRSLLKYLFPSETNWINGPRETYWVSGLELQSPPALARLLSFVSVVLLIIGHTQILFVPMSHYNICPVRILYAHL